MGGVNRRGFLKKVGAAGAIGGASVIGGRELLGGAALASHPEEHAGHTGDAGHEMHSGMHGAVGEVDHDRNGFSPYEILTDFDLGEVSTDSSGRTVREYDFVTVDKEIEVVPGVFFPAWTYNGRVPGPTIRCTDGDRLRITLTNASAHPHTMHFHGFHSATMDGVPGRRRGHAR